MSKKQIWILPQKLHIFTPFRFRMFGFEKFGPPFYDSETEIGMLLCLRDNYRKHLEIKKGGKINMTLKARKKCRRKVLQFSVFFLL